MAHIDTCLNSTIPPLAVKFSNEGEGAGLVKPPNIRSVGELVGRLTQPDSQVHMTFAWINPVDEHWHWVNEHVHDYDEVLIWTGNDPENPHDLGAEIYFDIEGERRTITTSGSVYIPAGTRHCPLGFNRVSRPFKFHALSLAPDYESRSVG